jgi:hypothetical protein
MMMGTIMNIALKPVGAPKDELLNIDLAVLIKNIMKMRGKTIHIGLKAVSI